ncbi:MAG: hypothetical protein AAF725_20945 [Acidobacteriota bacterium]
MIDELELPQVQEIGTYESRALAEMKPPHMEGSFFQDLGRRPFRIALWGVATGASAKEFIGALDEKFRAAEPVTFTADIAQSAEIERLVIRDLRLEELAGRPDRLAYGLTLEEYLEPAEPASAEPPGPGPLDDEVLAEASELMGDLADGLQAAAGFSSGLERFVPQLTGLLGRLRDFRGAGGA